MFQTLEPVSFTAVQKGGVSETVNSTAIELTFSKPVAGLTADDITITNGTGSAVKGALTGSGTTWRIALSRVDLEGTVSVQVRHFGDFFIAPNVRTGVEIYRGDVYDLTVRVIGGGTVSGDGTGQYLKGYPISVTSVPNNNCEFIGWTIEGAVITRGTGISPAEFEMPGNPVTLIANFTRDPNAPAGAGGDGDVSEHLNTDEHMRYVNGVGQNRFEPQRNITRAEIAQLFFNLLRDQNVGITKTFPDIQSSAWYARAVNTFASLGKITGYEDGNYRPGRDMSRAELVTIAVRFTEALPEETKPLPFNDVTNSHWAYDYIDAAVQFGWISGYPDGSFRPNSPITRAEVVTIVNNMLLRIADRDFIDHHPDALRFLDVSENFWAYYNIMEAFNAHDYRRYNDGSEEWLKLD